MADTPLAGLIQPFCASLSDLVTEIRGIAGAYQGANEKLYQESLALVTKQAGQVSFAGLGASAFLGSVKQSVTELASTVQTLSSLSTAASQCHDALTTQSSHSDTALLSAESALNGYQVDVSAVYGQATYPSTYLVEHAVAGLDLDSILQQGSSAVAPSFQSASLHLVMLAQAGMQNDPMYLAHVARAITAVNLLTEQMQSVCEQWATHVSTDVMIFTNAAMPAQSGEGNGQGTSGSNSLSLLAMVTGAPLAVLAMLLEGGGGRGQGGKGGGDPLGIDIGPLWEGSWKSQTLWQQSGNLGPVPVHNVGTVNIFDYEAGAHVGPDKKGGFDAGLTLGGDIFDWGDQAVFGTTNFGFTLGGDVKGPAVDAGVGINKDSLGADIGASPITLNGDAGLNIAGANVGVIGSVGPKIELGFEIGAKTELKLPFVSVGFSFGKAQTGIPG